MRQGVRLTVEDPRQTSHWAARQLARCVDQVAPPEAVREGLHYARLGQTRRLELSPGLIHASVQGRLLAPYVVSITLPILPPAAVDRMVARIAHDAECAAALLAGQVPQRLEQLLAGMEPPLVPPAEVLEPRCSCRRRRASASHHVSAPASPDPESESRTPAWCKHACCVAWLVIERVASDPFLLLMLRGIEHQTLTERIRQRRAAAASRDASIYTPHIEGITNGPPPPPLDAEVARFWDAGPALTALDLPIHAPPVPHLLLRRLGRSPFRDATFPLVGLLATCYDVISRNILDDAFDRLPSAEAGEASTSD